MLPILLTVGPLAAASANNIAQSQTPTSGTALTLNGSVVSGGVATLDVARRVLLTYGNEASARTLVVTGTNADKNPIQETLAVPSGAGGTVATTQDFLSIVSALPLGGGWTAAATLGTNTTASSPWKFLNSQHSASTQITWDGHIVAGSGTWGIEYTMSQVNDNQNQMGSAFGNYPTPALARPLTILTGQTQDGQASFDNPAFAWRAIITGVGFTLQVRALEGGIRGTLA